MSQNADPSEIVTIAQNGPLMHVWGIVATILAVLYTVILAVPTAMLTPFNHGRAATRLMRLWSWLIIRTCGVKVELDGLDNLEGLDSFVLVSNHQSLFDILAVMLYMPRQTRFVAKREIKKIPVLGYILEHANNIVVDRKRGGQAIRRSIEVARLGCSICVFAEGHRYSDNRVHEFNEGGAWLAIATRLPCIPMAVTGSAAIMPRQATFVVPGRRMRITLGRPIPTAGLKSSDRTELSRRLETEVRALFARTTSNPPI